MANVIAYTALDMLNPPTMNWGLAGRDSTQIVIADGLYQGIYRGSFTYNGLEVSGTLNSFEINYNGTMQSIISGLSIDASQVVAVIQSGQAENLYLLALNGNDSLTGSLFNDVLAGFGGDDVLKGDLGRDSLYGDAGNDRLFGGSGVDHLYGGVGDDVYYFTTSDVIVEDAGAAGGYDEIRSSVSVTVAKNVELLSLTGTDDINGTGNSGENRMVGNNGSNYLSGGAGNDSILGGKGQDTLRGGSGQDFLYGGTDALGDAFVFVARTESATGATRDSIYNFTRGADIIDLAGIDAVASSAATNQQFTFNGTTAHANAVWYVQSGTGIVVRADVTGDLVADFEIRLHNVTGIGAADFLL